MCWRVAMASFRSTSAGSSAGLKNTTFASSRRSTAFDKAPCARLSSGAIYLARMRLSSSSLFPKLAIFAVLVSTAHAVCSLPATPTGRIAAGLNPAYLNNLPSVDTVKQQIQGADPTDTLERQVAVFNILGAIMQHHLAGDRGRYNLTPDEQMVICVYRLAAYQIEEDYKKTHTDAELQAFSRRHGQYEMDNAMQKEIDTKLLSATAVAENRANDRSA